MTSREDRTELTEAYLLAKFAAVSRRFISMLEVLHDAIGPWLGGGRAKDIIESSEEDAKTVIEICHELLKNMTVAQMLLAAFTDSMYEYHCLCREEKEGDEISDISEEDHTSLRLLTIVCKNAREAADKIIFWRKDPTRWVTIDGFRASNERLNFELDTVDYSRWQILKEFANLVSLFDDHDDPDSDTPSEAWQKDQLGLDNDLTGEE